MHYLSKFNNRGDLRALEDIRQYSIVVKDEQGLRYIDPGDDITKVETYFVNQVFPIGNDELIIQKGRMIRTVRVDLNFRDF
jgi:hypothetical protein